MDDGELKIQEVSGDPSRINHAAILGDFDLNAGASDQAMLESLPEGMHDFNLMMYGGESTVVAECPEIEERATAYQSEAQLEEDFIQRLVKQAYERLSITCEEDLVINLRTQLEKLNNITFSDSEWAHFFSQSIASENDGIEEKTRRIQEDHVQLLKRDDGTTKNVRLIDKENIHNNHLQVLNQYESEGARATRYDVTILVNGLPLVHVELKRRGVELKEAFNQINRYQRDSFWSGVGLFEYVQIFVISNGTHTKYYSNTTRFTHIKENAGATKRSKKTSNSFEFTSWWADAANKSIMDLIPFTKTFFAKHSILNILTKYSIFTSQNLLLVMRPYQIVATERILNRILISENKKSMLGTLAAGGYVWHTTGSGKTLTSFKAAQLASKMDGIDKVLFVVDRKDLDYQTMKEYEKFEKGAVNSSKNTTILAKHLADPEKRIIVTTIQKLSCFIAKNKEHGVYDGHTVIIFDECHRSQFGEMHTAITKAFKNYHLFGFTGTPIFAMNAGKGGNPTLRTTAQAFGSQLHTYTIVDAINDGNVLPFRIDYVDTIKNRDDIQDKKVHAIDRERALLAPERINGVVSYILDHFDQKTIRSKTYQLSDRRVRGFNSIFATASIEAAKTYYAAFKKTQEERGGEPLKIAIIYSFAPNEEEIDGFMAEEGFETDGLDQPSRDFLDSAIQDYNTMFGTSFDTSSEGFQNYYKDLSEKIKERQLDMAIVVNMFLTGFDATTLNTLWVDKNLKQHGLIQAFSRTNRILNSVKTFGNIICFRDLEQEVNDAIALFGDKEATGIVLLKPYSEYFAAYQKRVQDLFAFYPLGEPIVGENAQKEFIKLFGAILRLINILKAFDEFAADDPLSDRDKQDYRSIYLDLYQEYRTKDDADKEYINDDLVFEVELIKQVEINIDYILLLVEKYHDNNCTDKEILADINRAIGSSIELRNKRDLIEQFINTLNVSDKVDDEWKRFVEEKKALELDDIINSEGLKAEETRAFMNNAFKDGYVRTTGTMITNILPPVSRFSPSGDHGKKKETVLEKLQAFFSRFYGIG